MWFGEATFQLERASTSVSEQVLQGVMSTADRPDVDGGGPIRSLPYAFVEWSSVEVSQKLHI